MKYIIILILLSVSYSCAPIFENHEIAVGYAPICSHLINDDPDYNETNDGIFFSYDNWFALTFENSHYERTFAVGYNLRTSKYKIENNLFVRGNLYFGIMNGYEEELPNIAGISPALAPTIEIGYKNFSINTMILPVVSSMFVYRFE